MLGPKIDGVQNLHTLTAEHALNHFLIFSSGAGLWGPVGQANHAAANAYLDAFAAWRAATGRPTQVIDWGAVRATGAAADEGVLERVRGMGLDALSVPAFDEALDRLWSGSPTQVAVLPRRAGPLPDPWAQRPFLRALVGTPPARSVPAPTRAADRLREEPWRELLRGLPPGRRRSRLRELLAGALVDVLHLHRPPDETEGFFDLGMDSLTAVEFRNRLQREFDLTFPANLLFDYPNLRKLTEHLDGSVIDPGASQAIGGAPSAAAVPAREVDDAVAIVGMACRFPGGAGLQEFWSTLRDGIDCSGPIPPGAGLSTTSIRRKRMSVAAASCPRSRASMRTSSRSRPARRGAWIRNTVCCSSSPGRRSSTRRSPRRGSTAAAPAYSSGSRATITRG